MGTGGFFLKDVKLTTHLNLVPMLIVELYLHTPIHLQGVMLD
jgi:hypothetical protein